MNHISSIVDLVKSDKMSQIKYLQIGNGRLGQLIANQVETSTNLIINHARIDPKLGLIDSSFESITGEIGHLVLCLSPSQSSLWQWNQIFTGLMNQVDKKELKINQAIFISSSRVYDGINKGLITAQTPVKDYSERANQLIRAEQQIEKHATSFHILRCSGLYGKEDQPYQKYREILTQKDDKVRFGVDINDVAKAVVKKLGEKVSSYSLLTDGYCYLHGESLTIESVSDLSEQNRLLVKSESF